jgi:hypothetical protein
MRVLYPLFALGVTHRSPHVSEWWSIPQATQPNPRPITWMNNMLIFEQVGVLALLATMRCHCKKKRHIMCFFYFYEAVAVVPGHCPPSSSPVVVLLPHPPCPSGDLSPLSYSCLCSLCASATWLRKHSLPSTIVGLQNQNCFWRGLVECVHLLHTYVVCLLQPLRPHLPCVQ